jgi:DNA polymerase III sliding clamp (beta) subunit (PCNA family)
LNVNNKQTTSRNSAIDTENGDNSEDELEFDENGLKIVALDNTHIVLIHLKLHADKFEKYYILTFLSFLTFECSCMCHL